MKNVFVKTLITAMASTLVLSACGTTPGALNGALSDTDSQYFSQLAVDGSPQFSAKGKPERDMKKGPQQAGQKRAVGFLKGIELTEAQQAEVKSIMEAAQAARSEKGEKPDNTAQEALKAKVKAAFISDSFDADALNAEIKALRSNDDKEAHHLARAEVQIKIWNVLTAEQQATVKTNAANFTAEDRPERPDQLDRSDKKGVNPFERMGLELTAEQSATLTAAFEAQKADKPERAERNPAALIEVLSSGSASAEAIVALHKAPSVERNPLAMLQTLHGVLTAEQRQVFAEKGLDKGFGSRGKRGGKHGGQQGHKGGQRGGAMAKGK